MGEKPKSVFDEQVEQFCDEMFEWVKSLGGPDIQKSVFKRSVPREHYLMWRHIMKHVQPKQQVELIRKNLALHRLKTDTDKDKCLPLKAVVKSPEDLERYKRSVALKKAIAAKEEEVEAVASSVRKLETQIRMTDQRLVPVREEIQDCVKKTHLLKLKSRQVEKRIEELNENMAIVRFIQSRGENAKTESERREKLLEFMAELESLHSSYSISRGNTVLEQDLLWKKADEMLYYVTPGQLMDFLVETVDRANDLFKQQLSGPLRLYGLPKKGASFNDGNDLQRLQVNIYMEYTKKKSSVKKLEEEIAKLRSKVVGKMLEKFSFSEDYREELTGYVEKKCSSVFRKAKDVSVPTQLAELRREVDALKCHDLVLDGLHKQIRELDSEIDEKSQMVGGYINRVVGWDAANSAKDVNSEIEGMVDEFCSAGEEENVFTEFQGSMKQEIMLFLKAPLFRKRIDDIPLLPSVISHFPPNRMTHLLPLQIFKQRLFVKELENIAAKASTVQIDQLPETSGAELEERRRRNKLEIDEKVESVERIVQSAEEALANGIDCAKLLREENNFNVLLKDDSTIGEHFVQVEEKIRDLERALEH